MRKTLAILLSLLMVVSLLCLGVSAAEGTAIATAEDFAAMKADGTYYLGADITISASYANKFTGTLDGNGHSVTVSAPMFTEFSGMIKNLTIQGEINITAADDAAANYGGAIANTVPTGGSFWLENVTNNANVTTASTRVGGFFGQVGSYTTLAVMIKCTNNGTIRGTSEETECLGGGFIGYMSGYSMTVNGCVNNGEVSVGKGPAGGFFGTLGLISDSYSEFKAMEFFNCLNTGKITGSAQVGGFVGYARGVHVQMTNCTNRGEVHTTVAHAGGLVGRGGESGYLSSLNFNKCINEGKIISDGEVSKVSEETHLPTGGTDCAGGIVGYCYGSKTDGAVHIDNCINLGEIGCICFASQFIGYCNNKLCTIKNSYGGGQLTGGAKVIMGLSSVNPPDVVGMENNKLGGLDNTEYFSYATAESNSTHIVKLEDYLKLEGINATAFANTTSDPSLVGMGYDAAASLPEVVTTVAPETTKKPVTTKKPETTKTPVTTQTPTTSSATPETQKTAEEKSGCGSVAAIGVAVIVTVMGAAVIRKKED